VKSHELVTKNHGLLRGMVVSLMRVSFCSFQCIRCGDTISCIYSNSVVLAGLGEVGGAVVVAGWSEWWVLHRSTDTTANK
jgi:hypothetical protein